jgi:hypothetical protein
LVRLSVESAEGINVSAALVRHQLCRCRLVFVGTANLRFVISYQDRIGEITFDTDWISLLRKPAPSPTNSVSFIARQNL